MWFGTSRALVLRGLVTIAFGVALLVWPSISLAVLIVLFGAFAVIDGGLILTMGLQLPSDTTARAVAVVAGALAIVVGVVTFFRPGATELVLLVLIALRAIVIGVAEVVTAVHLGRDVAGWLLALVGLLSITFGALLLIYPGAGLIALVWVIGAYAVVVGALGIARAWWITTSRYA